jgi:hypothetical protein
MEVASKIWKNTKREVLTDVWREPGEKKTRCKSCFVWCARRHLRGVSLFDGDRMFQLEGVCSDCIERQGEIACDFCKLLSNMDEVLKTWAYCIECDKLMCSKCYDYIEERENAVCHLCLLLSSLQQNKKR